MSDLTVTYLPCVRCGHVCVGQYHYIGARGPLCPSCFRQDINREAYLARPAYGAETDCEPRIRELEAETERLRKALERIRDVTYYKAITDKTDVVALAHRVNTEARTALGEERHGDRASPTWGEERSP